MNNYTITRIFKVNGVIDSNVNFTGISKSVCTRAIGSSSFAPLVIYKHNKTS